MRICGYEQYGILNNDGAGDNLYPIGLLIDVYNAIYGYFVFNDDYGAIVRPRSTLSIVIRSQTARLPDAGRSQGHAPTAKRRYNDL
jgi:hypothetical protein